MSATRRTLAAALPALLLCTPASTQESAAHFDAAVVLLDKDAGVFKRTLDLDADGVRDAVGLNVASNYGVSYLYLYANDGSGTFQELWTTSILATPSTDLDDPIAVGDLDGDGRQDFVAGIQDRLYPYLSNGLADPTALAPIQLPAGWGHAVDLVLCDQNGDGLDDIALLAEDRLALYTVTAGLDPADFGVMDAAVPPNETLTRLRALDVDGNGTPDLATCGDQRVWLLPVAGGAINSTPGIAHGLQDPALAQGDVDSDGDEDLSLIHI